MQNTYLVVDEKTALDETRQVLRPVGNENRIHPASLSETNQPIIIFNYQYAPIFQCTVILGLRNKGPMEQLLLAAAVSWLISFLVFSKTYLPTLGNENAGDFLHIGNIRADRALRVWRRALRAPSGVQGRSPGKFLRFSLLWTPGNRYSIG